jgi:hypothetical protein
VAEARGIEVPPFLVPYDEEVNPAQVALWLRWVNAELWNTNNELRRARDQWVQAKLSMDSALRAAKLSEDSPKVQRGKDSVTVDERIAWVEEKCEIEIWAEAMAAARVEAAKSKINVLRQIANDLQTLNANLRGDDGGRWK